MWKISLVIIVAFLGFMWYLYSSVDFSPDYLEDKIFQKNYPTEQALQEVTAADKAKFEKYLSKENSPMPKEHLDILEKEEELAADLVLPRKDINRLLDRGYLKGESGYRLLEDGSSYISVLTKMPGVSIEMIDWWFWWHAAAGERYQIWYPDMHYNLVTDFQGYYEDDTKSHRERLHWSAHLVNEDIGLGKGNILIDFMSPTTFGFDENKLNDQVTIICARAGQPESGAWATDMVHFVRATDDGVEMRSRFWFGHKVRRVSGFGKPILNTILNQPFVKKRLLPPTVGKALFHHCSQEFHNLAAILPQVYAEEFSNGKK